MIESEALAVLEKTLPRFRTWIDRNCSLWTALQAADKQDLLEAEIEPIPATQAESAPIDPRLEAWLERSRSVLTRELAAAFEKIRKNSPEHDPHPALLPFGLLGEQSTAALHETLHTKLLAWFLDPSKPHGFGDLLLRTVCSLTTLREPIAKAKALRDVRVQFEHRVDGGRIDIAVYGNLDDIPFSVWIEAKTSSGEGKRQLYRYGKSIQAWKEKHRGNSLAAAIFLTPDGRVPRPERADGADLWKPIAFPQLALALWNAARDQPDAAARDLLRLYLASLLRDFSEWSLPIGSEADYAVIDYVRGVL